MSIDANLGETMPFEKVYKLTVADTKITAEVEFIQSFFENWVGEFVHPFEKDMQRSKKLEQSLYFCYLAAESMVFDWLAHSLLNGVYETVLRELRSILEGLFAVYYVEVNHQHETLAQKLFWLKELEGKRLLSGKRVFENSKLEHWREYYSLYSELCAYVHNTTDSISVRINQVVQEGFTQAVEPQFDESMFVKTVDLWRRIAVVVMELTQSFLEELDVEVENTNLYLFKFDET